MVAFPSFPLNSPDHWKLLTPSMLFRKWISHRRPRCGPLGELEFPLLVILPFFKYELPMKNTLVRNTATISFFSGCGVVSSFAVDVSIAALFGLGSHTDAFFVAATIPLLTYVIFNGFAELALVPVFVGWREKLKQGMWEPFSTLLNLTGLGLLAVVMLGLAFSGVLFFAIGPGLPPSARRLTTRLGQIMLLLIPLNGLIALCRAMLNSMKEFAASASSNLLRNLVVLAFLCSALIGSRSIEKAALGYLFAGVIQCITLLLILHRRGFRFHPALDLRNAEVRTAISAAAFPLFSFSINQSNEIVERILTSFLAPGSLSALIYARRIAAAIVNVFMNSTASAIIPSLSVFAVREDTGKLQRTLRQGITIVLLIALPLTTLLLVLNEPLVRIAFLRGAMTQSNTQLVASILLVYTIALPFLGLNQLLIAPHYALEDTRTPSIHLLVKILVHVILDILLFSKFGLFGIPLALGITGVISVIRAVWLLRKKRLTVLNVTTFTVTVKLLVASSAMGFTMYSINRWATSLMESDPWIQIGLTGLIMLCGGTVLLVVLRILGLRGAEFTA